MTTQLTINDARRQANCFSKALALSGEGYTWNELASKLYRVFKPENTTQDTADYIVDLMLIDCSCPDFKKHGVFCKHTLWLDSELKKMEAEKEQAEEEAYWEAVCEAYDLAECANGVDYLL